MKKNRSEVFDEKRDGNNRNRTLAKKPRARSTDHPDISRPRTVVLRTSNQENPGFSRFPPTFDLGLSSDLLPSELVLLDPGSTGPQDFRNSGLGRTIPLYHTVHSALLFCVLCSVFCTYVRTVLYGSVLCSTAVPALVSSHKKHRQRNLIGHAHLLSNIIHPTQHRFI